MPTSAEVLLLDSSAALALALSDHPLGPRVRDAVKGHRLGLAGHAEPETYSVLTRLPPPRRLAPAAAMRLIETNFPETRRLDDVNAAALLGEFATAGIAGGQVYDALVGAAARDHQLTLLSCDARAAATYRAMGTRFRLL